LESGRDNNGLQSSPLDRKTIRPTSQGLPRGGPRSRLRRETGGRLWRTSSPRRISTASTSATSRPHLAPSPTSFRQSCRRTHQRALPSRWAPRC